MIDDTTSALGQETQEDTDEESVVAPLLAKQYPSLPDDIHGLIASGKFVTEITTIFDRHHIASEVRMPLTSLVFDILVGQISPEKFVPMVLRVLPQQEVGVAFSQDVNRSIFSGVKEGLLFLHNKKVSPTSSSPVGALKDRVEPKALMPNISNTLTPDAKKGTADVDTIVSSSQNPPQPKPPLVSTPDYREPSTLEQKLSSFSMKPAAQSPSATPPQKIVDPYRETV